MSISLDSLSDNFNLAHMFKIASIVFSSQSKTKAMFYRLSKERCLPSNKKVFSTSVREGNLEGERERERERGKKTLAMFLYIEKKKLGF